MNIKKNRILAIFVAALLLSGLSFLILSATAQIPTPTKSPADDAYQRIFEDQIARTKRYEGLLARQEELMKRQEELMKHQDEGAVRFISICEKWDKQQQQYQKYLDGLGKK
ncbi:MAG TPA: hypothetical protein VFE46_00040 [Pirellulales bacterium]|jgi:hypothetical protein|nr:hypothetical protein [Pirellulales bacterium]